MTKLTKAELKIFNDNLACNEACEKLVERVVRHFEMAAVERSKMWQRFIAKYKLDTKKSWQIDPLTGDLFEASEARIRQKNIDDIDAKLDRIIKPNKKKK